MFLMVACGSKDPQPISYGKDLCDHCQMGISDNKFGAELITKKGRVYKFDDIACLEGYQEENSDKTEGSVLYVTDFDTKKLIPANKATFIYGGALESPMGGNKAAFSDANKAKEYAQKLGASFFPTTIVFAGNICATISKKKAYTNFILIMYINKI